LPAANIALIALPDVAVAREDVPAQIASVDLLRNDSPGSAKIISVSALSTQGGKVHLGDNGRLEYSPPLNFNGIDSFIYTITDGTTNDRTPSTATGTVVVKVKPVNDRPVNLTPGPQELPEDAILTFATVNGNVFSVSDVDVGTGNLQVRLSTAAGTLTLPRTAGLTFSLGDGAADSAMTFSGSAADVNAALDGLTFSPTLDRNGSSTITITVSDLGGTGSGGVRTDTDVVTVNISAINDSPVNLVSGPQAIVEDGTLIFSAEEGNHH